MQWHNYREKHDNKLLFKCIFMNVQIRAHRRKKNKTYYNARYKRKVIIIILKKQDYILFLFALFI